MVNIECRRAGIGCVDCKKMLARNLNRELEPFRAQRITLAENRQAVWDVLHDGARRAREIAEATMVEVRDAMGMSHQYEAPNANAAESK